MIPEIQRSIGGAWRLFLNRPEGLDEFNVSVDGFWRSFAAMFMALPFFIVWALQQPAFVSAAFQTSEPLEIDWTARIVAFGLSWILFPVLVGLAARSIGIGDTFVRYVIARNWATLLGTAFLSAVALLIPVGTFGVEVVSVVSLAAVIIVLRYSYLVARHAAGVGFGLALGLTIGDYLLTFLVESATFQLLGG